MEIKILKQERKKSNNEKKEIKATTIYFGKI